MKHMPATPMTKEEMETQCRLVSMAALGDPGEELEFVEDRKGNLLVARQTAMCPECGGHPAQDCGYGEWSFSDHGYDFDCTHPDAGDLECPCKFTKCPVCLVKSAGLR